MAFVLKALRIGKDTGHHAAHRVRHRHGGDLPAGEHKVAQRDLLVAALLNEALVDALVVAADQHQMVVVPQQPSRLVLVERPALGGHIDHPAAAALSS